MILTQLVISKPASLTLDTGCLVIEQTDSKKRIHIKDIEILIIESSAVSITAALLQALTIENVKVVFCDGKRLPSCEIMPYYGTVDTSRKIRKQIAWSEEAKNQVWQEIVTQKLKRQVQVLEELRKSEAEILKSYLEERQFTEIASREGVAARVYFQALFGKTFTRGQEIPVNAALNYGYTIIMSAFSRAIVASGYITTLGLHHENVFNSFNLAADLMEPLRPMVDKVVIDMSRDSFDKEQKQALINLLNQSVSVQNRKERLGRAILLYCRSVFVALEKEDISLIQWVEY